MTSSFHPAAVMPSASYHTVFCDPLLSNPWQTAISKKGQGNQQHALQLALPSTVLHFTASLALQQLTRWSRDAMPASNPRTECMLLAPVPPPLFLFVESASESELLPSKQQIVEQIVLRRTVSRGLERREAWPPLERSVGLHLLHECAHMR